MEITDQDLQSSPRYKPINEMLENLLQYMKNNGYEDSTLILYRRICNRLLKFADSHKYAKYNKELGQLFMKDTTRHKGKPTDSLELETGDCHNRFLYHYRLVQLLESYIAYGNCNWSQYHKITADNISVPCFKTALFSFLEYAKRTLTLSKNTIDGYQRIIKYFLIYLEKLGYQSFQEVQDGDVLNFIQAMLKEHYSITSIGAHISGLRAFLKMDIVGLRDKTCELPVRLPKRKNIIDVLTDAELSSIDEKLAKGTNHAIGKKDELSLRDKAIGLIAFKSGLRAIDICGLKLQDIDWQRNQICVNQAKTHKKVYIPLIDDIGNALVDYLLNERYSKSKSEYVFLVQKAPYIPLISHSGCRDILEKIERLSGTITDNRIIGSRMTRHTYASYLLRHGVSLAIIAQALGHRSVDVTMRYLSTDEAALAQCTLPLPTCSLNENEAKS